MEKISVNAMIVNYDDVQKKLDEIDHRNIAIKNAPVILPGENELIK